MLDKIILDALNEQLTVERMNAANYDALSAACDVAYWPGAMAWMHAAADDERQHAQKIAAYIVDRDGVPVYQPLGQPVAINAETLTPAFEAALRLETATTEAIKSLYYTAETAEDPQTHQFLLWFLEEQTESEAVLRDYLLMLRRLDNNGKLLFDAGLLK